MTKNLFHNMHRKNNVFLCTHFILLMLLIFRNIFLMSENIWITCTQTQALDIFSLVFFLEKPHNMITVRHDPIKMDK